MNNNQQPLQPILEPVEETISEAEAFANFSDGEENLIPLPQDLVDENRPLEGTLDAEVDAELAEIQAFDEAINSNCDEQIAYYEDLHNKYANEFIVPADVPTTDIDLAQEIADENRPLEGTLNSELAELMIENVGKDGEVEWEYEYLMSHTIRDLKAMAKGAGIKNYSRWSKYQLANALMNL